jgi:isopropylmalate/homocitrate/citramalate synthase
MSRRKITIVEVGPRDGLQSEPEILSTDDKVDFISRAIDAGIKRLEVASFVHPKRVPQMADACGDRHVAPHEASLFDMNAKYGDVVDEAMVIEQLDS